MVEPKLLQSLLEVEEIGDLTQCDVVWVFGADPSTPLKELVGIDRLSGSRGQRVLLRVSFSMYAIRLLSSVCADRTWAVKGMPV